MNHIIAIILYIILGIVLIIEYIKDKKLHRLLAIIYIPVVIFFQLPISNKISKPLSNLLIIFLFLLMLFIFYLILKDEKNKDQT